MRLSIARTACAALLLSFAAGTASAADRDNSSNSAISTGLAIPIDPVRQSGAEIPNRGRAILVDAGSARLFMIEDGRVVDSMKVIVGKPSAETPEIKSLLYAATLKPYWHVPVDLARTIIAPRVLKDGFSYLDERGYEVISGFSRNPSILDPADVDWQAVADGSETVYVRQRPGPANSMGRIKFGFANNNGIFLHDTPRKELFSEADRNISNGCVRLEDADRLAQWLLGRKPNLQAAAPEQLVGLPTPVPIVITYLGEREPVQVAALR